MYVEDLLALNFLMNTVLLYFTARLTGRRLKGGRLLAGGFFSALYSLIIFLPAADFAYTWLGKIGASILIIIFTFRPARLVEGLRLCGAFFLASFFLAGTVFALYFFGDAPAMVQGGVFYLTAPRPGLLFGGVLVSLLLLAGVWHFSERQRRSKSLRFRVTIKCGDKSVEVAGLVDTGNHLRDPLSGRPLSVASYGAVEVFLPTVLQQAYRRAADPVSALGELTGPEAVRYGVTPFRSLENAGVLVTFRPDKVVLEGTGVRQECDDLVFAISAKALSLDNEAEILLNPAIMDFIGGASY
ncbi:MAG: sigma-E processing peptidase SpoIIGA [Firmicutes bacterium]|jgi:stage II sporulation protein GA (sporulation sigma-E factor processing peptidase)|nr:sigma-E processing peptidase SpoIIGA [Bacillota bacterium]MCL5992813.1 sigma-E processing peptidase SpoIIGA [Bacillota bacterium]